MKCVSCNRDHEEKFCPNCGERAGVKQITFSSIVEDSFTTLTDMDKGFLFNIKALITKPGKLTTEYILGKRKGILNPISFLIISISLYLIVESLFKTPILESLFIIPNEVKEPILENDTYTRGYSIGQAAGKFIFSYYKYFLILTIFLHAISTKIVYGIYNYIEHIAISSLIIGLAVLGSIIPYIFFVSPIIFNPVFYIIIFLLIHKIFRNDRGLTDSLLASLLSLFLFFVQLFMVVVGIGFIMSNIN